MAGKFSPLFVFTGRHIGRVTGSEMNLLRSLQETLSEAHLTMRSLFKIGGQWSVPAQFCYRRR
jgi:hypothetical protein